MKRTNHKNPIALALALGLVFLGVSVLHAQTRNTYGGGYSTGYGTVYGSFGQAMATQNMYNHMQLTMQKTMARNRMIAKWGLAAVQKAEREAGTKSSAGSKTTAPSTEKIVVPPPPVVRNHGIFRPDPANDTGKAFADALGDTPEEKALIKQIYTRTKEAYEKEAGPKGWKNNLAGALTFFTVTAMTVYRDAEEPSVEAVDAYYKVLNTTLDEMPEFGKVTNRDKQNSNNMLIGFAGVLIAGYTEGKQTADAGTIESYRKLAGGLIQLVLKTDPENLQIENGQIVLK